VLNDAFLGRNIEIDQHVAAKDQIHALHERHLGVVAEIEAGEVDAGADLVFDLKFVAVGGGEVFPPVEVGGVAQRVGAVDAGLGGFDGTIIEVGCGDLEGPTLEELLALLQRVLGPDTLATERKRTSTAGRQEFSGGAWLITSCTATPWRSTIM
jgi:hypothetical protein